MATSAIVSAGGLNRAPASSAIVSAGGLTSAGIPSSRAIVSGGGLTSLGALPQGILIYTSGGWKKHVLKLWTGTSFITLDYLS